MQRHEVKGRKLVVKDDGGVTRDKSGAILGGRRNNNNRDNDRFRDDHHRGDLGNSLSLRNNDESKWGNTYGLSPQFLESLKIDPPLNNKVFVANVSILDIVVVIVGSSVPWTLYCKLKMDKYAANFFLIMKG